MVDNKRELERDIPLYLKMGYLSRCDRITSSERAMTTPELKLH
jgi:hypothetical protein